MAFQNSAFAKKENCRTDYVAFDTKHLACLSKNPMVNSIEKVFNEISTTKKIVLNVNIDFLELRIFHICTIKIILH